MSEELNLFLGNANLEALARAHNKLVKSLTGKIKTLESRLYALETQKDHIAHAFDLQSDWNAATRVISERHSRRLSALEGAHNLVAAQVLSDIKKGLPENVGLANEADMFVKSALEHPEPDNGTTVNKAHDEGVIYGLNLAKSMAENLKRLNVGSIPDRLLTDIEAMKQDFQFPEPDKQPSVQPAETEREWIKWNDPVWLFWDTGEITLEKALDLGRLPNATHIMPYNEGDKRPEPPKGDK